MRSRWVVSMSRARKKEVAARDLIIHLCLVSFFWKTSRYQYWPNQSDFFKAKGRHERR